MTAWKKRLRIVRHFALGIALGATSHACQETPGTAGGAAVCTYGETIPCGPENKCTSTCLPDLSAYGPCMCGDGGADAGDGGKQDAR